MLIHPWLEPIETRHPLELLHGACAWANRAQEYEIVLHGMSEEYFLLACVVVTLECAKIDWLTDDLHMKRGGTKVPLPRAPGKYILM